MRSALLLAGLMATGLVADLEAGESSSAAVLPGDPYAGESTAQRDKRMAWWREARFGMFIHWGVYAVPAGSYEGEPVDGIGEWILRNAKIPSAVYRGYAKDFTAENYDPQAWAKLAKEAGMRYMVITSKHHDGFALYPSEVTDWDVVDAGGAKRDLIAPLAKAARAEGLKFGLYYSQAQDWIHPGGTIYGYKEGEVINEDHKGSFDQYLKDIAVPQVREILTRYEPDVLWWDTPIHMTQKRAQPLASLLALRPGIIHNNRLGGGYLGDTETPEQFIPPTGFGGRDWETCMTMNTSWGYKSDDDNWKPAEVLIANLINAASKGGNYLLNIGPDATGRVPEESVRLLKEVGAWMKVNGEAIYGTTASPFSCRLPWGRCTSKREGRKHVLYAHVYDWPVNQKLLLPGLQTGVKSAKLLASGDSLQVTNSPHGPVVLLPKAPVDKLSTTIKLVLGGPAKVRSQPVLADPDAVIRLSPLDAKLEGDLKLGQRRGREIVTRWHNSRDHMTWELEATHGGTYLVQLQTACAQKGAVILIEGKGVCKLACAVPKTETMRSFETTKVGEFKLKKGTKLSLRLKPVADGWKPVNLRMVELVPVH